MRGKTVLGRMRVGAGREELDDEGIMKENYLAKKVRRGLKRKRVIGIGVVGMLAGAMMLAPLAGARGVREEDGIMYERTIDRAQVENLQRWVSSGHEDWCRDARLVAAQELWRLAPEYSGGGFELNAIGAETIANDGNRVTFEWAPLDGRAVYRVTVERFDWLLPIARDAEAIVWVPTSTEMRIHNMVLGMGKRAQCERVQSKWPRACREGTGRPWRVQG